MSDEIDRSVEPELGADAKKKEDLPTGVRVRARSKKDATAKKTGKKIDINLTVESPQTIINE